MQFKYGLINRIAFYWSYFTTKVFSLWFEVKYPKLKMFIYEMLYSSMKLIDHTSLLASPFNTDLVETKFGIFKIRPHTSDMSNCSPAFERRDIDYLLHLIEHMKKEGRKILFLDIGADIGTFTVTVGNRSRSYENLRIMAFEPALSSYSLLKENILLNNLSQKAEPFNIALFSEDNREVNFLFNTDAPGSSSITFSGSSGRNSEKVPARALDSVIGERIKDYDTVIFKMDVEGAEKDVLIGADRILKSDIDVYLVVEDFVNPEIIDFLENTGAEFLFKLTPYNSWWRYTKKL